MSFEIELLKILRVDKQTLIYVMLILLYVLFLSSSLFLGKHQKCYERKMAVEEEWTGRYAVKK